MDPSFLIFDSLGHFGLAAAVLFFAELVYLVLGFGVGLIALGLMALFHPDLQDLVVVLMVVNLPIEATVVWRGRGAIRKAHFSNLALGLVLGMPAGVLLLVLGGSGGLFIPLVILLIAAGLLFCILPDRARLQPRPWMAVGAGGLSGFLSGLMGTGGPPMVLYFLAQGLEKRAFRNRLLAVFLLGSLLRIPAYGIAGLFTADRLLAALALFPALLVGALLGHQIHLRLPARAFRLMLGGLLLAIGFSLILNFLF